jgi:CheY-like chemotaxis protein
MTQSLPPKSLVLYADDDRDDQALMREIFSPYSGIVELRCYDNGAQLLEYMEALAPLQPQPALVILDINMPLVTGLQALRRIRSQERWSDLPIVIFTTSTQPHEATLSRQLGAGFVTKPLNTVQVHQIVDQMLEYCTEEFKEKMNKVRGN